MDGHDQMSSLLHILGCQTIPSLTTCKIVYKGTVSSLTPGFLGFQLTHACRAAPCPDRCAAPDPVHHCCCQRALTARRQAPRKCKRVVTERKLSFIRVLFSSSHTARHVQPVPRESDQVRHAQLRPHKVCFGGFRLQSLYSPT